MYIVLGIKPMAPHCSVWEWSKSSRSEQVHAAETEGGLLYQATALQDHDGSPRVLTGTVISGQ